MLLWKEVFSPEIRMSRHAPHRTVFVGAAWFAVLMSVCIVALVPSTRGLTRTSRSPDGNRETPQRTRSQRPPIVDRPAWAELRGANSPVPKPEGAEPIAPRSQSLVTAKPTIPAASSPRSTTEPAAASPAGPALPPPRNTVAKPNSALPSPLRGLEVPAPLSVDVIPPVSAVEAEVTPFVVRVCNATATDAHGVVVSVRFDESWELPGSEDLSVEQRLGFVPAGETRELMIALLPVRSGQLTADFQITSDSHPQQRLAAGAEVDPRVVELALAGPRRRSPGQRAEFLLTVRNTTTSDLPDARVDVEFDAGVLAVREASTGSETRTGAIAWPLGILQRGERVQIQIEYECLAESLRSPISAAFSSAGRTLRACGGALEVVPVAPIDIAIVDADDPWTVGDEAKIAIRIRNRTQAVSTDVALRLSTSPHFQQLAVQAPATPAQAKVTADSYGADVQFTGLAPNAEVVLQATARCALPGDGIIRVLVQSPSLAAPFEVEEAAVVNAPLAAE